MYRPPHLEPMNPELDYYDGYALHNLPPLTDSDIIARAAHHTDRSVVLALYRNMRRGITPNSVPNMALGRRKCKTLLLHTDPDVLINLVQANPELGLAITFFKPID